MWVQVCDLRGGDVRKYYARHCTNLVGELATRINHMVRAGLTAVRISFLGKLDHAGPLLATALTMAPAYATRNASTVQPGCEDIRVASLFADHNCANSVACGAGWQYRQPAP